MREGGREFERQGRSERSMDERRGEGTWRKEGEREKDVTEGERKGGEARIESKTGGIDWGRRIER